MSSPCMWGCFYYTGRCPDQCPSLPHACGGVSLQQKLGSLYMKSSPCMWGCFHEFPLPVQSIFVFPMHVGVFPSTFILLAVALCLPHACGGVSTTMASYLIQCTSSPCMWGCFHVILLYKSNCKVFPMHVGVFLVILFIKN